jgi:hypothetical protein
MVDVGGLTLTLLIGPGAVPLPVPRAVVDALLSVQVQVTSGQRSGFLLTFGVSKGSKLLTSLLPLGYFDPPNRVIVVVTIKGSPTVIMDGVITRHGLGASNEPGQSTLSVMGEDISRMMDIIEIPGIPYPMMPVEGRVVFILAKYAPLGLIPLVLPSVMVAHLELPTSKIRGHRGTDLKYLTHLAEQVGYVFYVEPGPLPATNIAYWGPEIKVGLPQPALSVNTDAHSNVEALSFSFDGFAKSIYFVLTHEETTGIPFPIPIPDVSPFNPPLGAKIPLPLRVRRVPDVAHASPLQAAAIGIGRASKSADVISARGSLDVMRYGRILKARRLVGVRGAGLAYDGLYYVKSVTHTIRRGQYKQSFELSRNALIPYTTGVPV